MRRKTPQRDPNEHKAVAFVRYLTRVHGRLHQWRRLSGMPTTAEAVHLAVQRGWVECVGGHGVALTDIGRQMVHHWERAKQVKRGLRVADKRANALGHRHRHGAIACF